MSLQLREEIVRTELALQSKNLALEVADRKRIFRHAVMLFALYAFVFITLMLILRYAKDQAKECGNDIHKHMYIMMVYFGICACR